MAKVNKPALNWHPNMTLERTGWPSYGRYGVLGEGSIPSRSSPLHRGAHTPDGRHIMAARTRTLDLAIPAATLDAVRANIADTPPFFALDLENDDIEAARYSGGIDIPDNRYL